MGAGEMSEEDAGELAENKKLVGELRAELEALRSENQQLRARHTSALDSDPAGSES